MAEHDFKWERGEGGGELKSTMSVGVEDTEERLKLPFVNTETVLSTMPDIKTHKCQHVHSP